MTDVKVLKSLAGTESSGVRLLKDQELTLSLSQSYATNLEFGVTKVLASKLLEYEPSLNGVLLNKEDCRNIRMVFKDNGDAESFHVSLQADCYVFSPAVGTKLKVEIVKVGEKFATAQVLKSFKVYVASDKKLRAGQSVTIKIVSVAYNKGVPDISGELVSISTQENGVTHTEPTTPKTPKRKKEESSDEKNKKVKSNETIPTVPSTPTSAAKKAGPKTPREKFELPEGFTVEEKKTEKKSWKEYRGPDGKKFRSIAEIQRSLSGTTKDSNANSKPENTNDLDQQIIEDISKNVENSWKIAADGEISKSKNKWYKSEALKGFPKKEHYFIVENAKSPKKKKQEKEKED